MQILKNTELLRANMTRCCCIPCVFRRSSCAFWGAVRDLLRDTSPEQTPSECAASSERGLGRSSRLHRTSKSDPKNPRSILPSRFPLFPA